MRGDTRLILDSLRLPSSGLWAYTNVSAVFKSVLKVCTIINTSYRSERWCQAAWGEGTCSSHIFGIIQLHLKQKINTGTNWREWELVSWEKFKTDALRSLDFAHTDKKEVKTLLSITRCICKAGSALSAIFSYKDTSWQSKLHGKPPPVSLPHLSSLPLSLLLSLIAYLSLSLSFNLNTLSDACLCPVLTCLPASHEKKWMKVSISHG